MMLLLFLTSILCLTVIVPYKNADYRLTYDINDEPRVILSSINEDTISNDLFSIGWQSTRLQQNGVALCKGNGNKLELCDKEQDNPLVFKVDDMARTVRFKGENNKCLTVEESFPVGHKNDYAVEFIPCDQENENQWFVLNVKHGEALEIN